MQTGLSVRYMHLLDNAQGNAYILHHAALRMKEGSPPGPELRTEIRGAFAAYLENVVLVRWDSDLLEFLMQVSVVDEFTLQETGTLNKDWLHRLLAEAEEVARRYPLYLKKRAAVAADFKGVALTILRLQADGLSVNRIAQRLDLKPDNVKYHIKENYRKLNADNKTDALLAARSLGLL